MPRFAEISTNDPIDLCKECYEGHDMHYDGAFEPDVPHPPYEECDYNCDDCHKPLTEKDN